jgi:outer membrane murein-binding lipoprotein Lpp
MTASVTVKHRLGTGASILAAAVMGTCVAGPTPAAAQDAATLQSIQQQILQLQAQLKKLQADAARRDAELKQAKEEAARARATTANTSPVPGPRQPLLVNPGVTPAATPPVTPSIPSTAVPGSAFVTMPPNDKDASGTPYFNTDKPTGKFNIGGLTISLGGWFELDGIYRSRNENAGVSNNFNSAIPFPNSPNYNTGELRASAQRTRIALGAEGNPFDGDKLMGYFESDFISAGSSSNSNTSNGYTMRIRHAFVDYDDKSDNFNILVGQAYTLLVPFKSGLSVRSENIPPTLEDNYIQGFPVARQPQLRVTTRLGDSVWLGASIESPQSTFGGTKPTINDVSIQTGSVPFSATTPAANTGSIASGNLNPLNSYSYNTIPDIIVKGAVEPGFGHYELFGIARFLKDEKVYTDGSGDATAVGGGIGTAASLPVIPGRMELLGNVLVGYGIGRYGPGGLPDATYKANGSPQPLPEIEASIGVIGHPTPKLDLFAFGGIEAVERNIGGTGGNAFGYGNPSFVNTGCDVISAATVQPACTANTRAVAGLQIGGWYTWLHGGYGTLLTGLQYQYDKRTTFRGVGGSPSTDENMIQVVVRYIPFQ